MQKPDKDSDSLRDGAVDLETGVVGKTTDPELRTQALFRDHFIGVVRVGHPLSQGSISPPAMQTADIFVFLGGASTRGR